VDFSHCGYICKLFCLFQFGSVGRGEVQIAHKSLNCLRSNKQNKNYFGKFFLMISNQPQMPDCTMVEKERNFINREIIEFVAFDRDISWCDRSIKPFKKRAVFVYCLPI
jgi:hypothetical protein